MQDKFSFKIDDFVQWCKTAIEHYNKGYYADALLNMRKSGEAACKLLFFYKYSEKVALEKTKDKSYKELIQILIYNNLAERKVINWLETIQIYGNEAAHDNQVEKEHAEFAINALKLLINWVFSEHVKTSIPASLKQALSSAPQTVKEQNTGSKKRQKKTDKITVEKEELEKLITSLSDKKNNETEKLTGLASELEKSIAFIKDFRQEKEKEQKEPEEKKPEPLETESQAEIKDPDEVKKPSKKSSFKKAVYVLMAVAALLFILFFTTKQWNAPARINDNNVKGVSLESIDSLYVVILPFSVMQDNPNITFRFEEAMQNNIKQRIKEKRLPVTVFFDSDYKKNVISKDEAHVQAARYRTAKRACMILYGELYEPLSIADSSRLNIRWAYRDNVDSLSGENGLQTFLRFSDSLSTKLQKAATCYVSIAYAFLLTEKGKHNEALAILYDLNPPGVTQQRDVADLLAKCHTAIKNYTAAIKETEKLIALQTENLDYGYHMMANILFWAENYALSEIYYKKAFEIAPTKPYLLLDYANLLANPAMNQLSKSKELLLKTVYLDSTVSLAWRYLADLEAMNGNFKKAENYYLKSFAIDSNLSAKLNLARLISFKLNKPEEGEKIMLELLKKDSTYSYLLRSLFDLYTSTKLQNSEKAKYFLEKSKKYDPASSEFQNKFSDGIIAINRKDFKKGAEFLTAAYRIDSSGISLYQGLSTCYYQLGDIKKAFHYANTGLQKDSLDYIINGNLGYFYMNSPSPYQDVKKSIYHFGKTLKINPYDTIALKLLSTLQYDLGNIPEAKKILLRYYDLEPNNFITNKKLAGIYWEEKDYKNALKYCETALALNPNDDMVNCKYASIIIMLSPNNYPEAFKYAKRAAELNPNNPENLYTLSQIYIYYTKDYNRGKEYYEKAIALDPSYRKTEIEQELSRIINYKNR